MPIKPISGVVLEIYSELGKGAKSGREMERRETVGILVNAWVSWWAERGERA